MFKKLCLVLLMSLSCFATDVYIDTDESTGTQDGTTWETAYDCLQDALSARAGVLTEDIHFYYKASDGTADVNSATLTGYTKGVYEIYFTQSDFPTDGKWSDSAYRLAVPASDAISVKGLTIANTCRIDGLQVLVTRSGNTYGAIGISCDAALNDNYYLNRIYIKGNCSGGITSSPVTAGIYCYETSTRQTLNLTNSIVTGLISGSASGYAAIYMSGSVNCNIYNCVITNNRYGISGGTGTEVVRNCVSFNNTYADSDMGSIGTVEYCATDDTYEGTGNIDWDNGATDWAANFTDYANGDFTIKDNSAGIYHAGTDVDLVTDITGYNWYSTPSIGAFEYVVIPVRRPRIININMN